MTKFNELGIKPTMPVFTGDKIKLIKILNQEIIVHRYKIEDSKYPEKGNGKRLVLQLEYKESQYILFSGSVTLMDMIKQVPDDKFPLTTTIIKNSERPEFT